MKKINMVIIALVILVVIAFSASCMNRSTDNPGNNAKVQNGAVDNNSDNDGVEEEAKPVKEDISEWKGHDLGKYKFVLTNDEYAIVVKKIDKVEDTIRLTYTFINESEDDSSALWSFQCVPFQNGTNVNDKYKSSYYECGSEQTSVRSGYAIEDCWELIPIGDGSEIECDPASKTETADRFWPDPSRKWSLFAQ